MQTEIEQLPAAAENTSGTSAPSDDSLPSARWFLRPSVLLRTILALTFAAYLQTIGFDFVSDDTLLITTNPWMKSWHSVPAFFTRHMWAFDKFHIAGNFYRPLFLLSLFWIQHTTGGAPGWFHLATVLLHLGVVAEVYILARMLTRDATVAVLAALIFALHPGKVEVVAWISGMTELFCALFVFAALICWLHWEDTDQTKWLFAALGSFALALLSKESAVLMPSLLAIYEWCAHEGSWFFRIRRAISRVWAFVALTVIYLLWRMHVMHGLWESPLLASWPKNQLLGAPVIFLWYIRRLLWPFQVSLLYDPEVVRHATASSLALPALATLAIGAVICRSAPNRAVRALLLWWLPLLLAPVVFSFAILQTHDRYLYLPSFAFAVAVAYLLSWGRRIKSAAILAGRAALVVGLTAVLLVGTIRESRPWRDDVALQERSIQVAPSYPLAYCSLAGAYLDVGRDADARKVLQETAARFPDALQAWVLLGRLEYKAGNLDTAQSVFTQALKTPYREADKDFSLYNLGLIAQAQGNLPAAEQWFRKSIAANPNSSGARQALDDIVALKGHLN